MSEFRSMVAQAKGIKRGTRVAHSSWDDELKAEIEHARSEGISIHRTVVIARKCGYRISEGSLRRYIEDCLGGSW